MTARGLVIDGRVPYMYHASVVHSIRYCPVKAARVPASPCFTTPPRPCTTFIIQPVLGAKPESRDLDYFVHFRTCYPTYHTNYWLVLLFASFKDRLQYP